MLVNAVTYTFPLEVADEVAGMLRELREASLLESGCRGFEVSRSNDDPRLFVLYETWKDRAALDAHYVSDHFQRLGVSGIRPLAQSRVGYLCTPVAE